MEKENAQTDSRDGHIELYDELMERIRDNLSFSERYAHRYTWAYWTLKGIIVVLSACAAAKALGLFQSIAAGMSLAVAILTSLDALVKPEARWKSHDVFNGLYLQYKSELVSIGSADKVALNEFRKRLGELDGRYSKERLP
jgi:hypothetical protein